jgi:hypothetical protein
LLFGNSTDFFTNFPFSFLWTTTLVIFPSTGSSIIYSDSSSILVTGILLFTIVPSLFFCRTTLEICFCN